MRRSATEINRSKLIDFLLRSAERFQFDRTVGDLYSQSINLKLSLSIFLVESIDIVRSFVRKILEYSRENHFLAN